MLWCVLFGNILPSMTEVGRDVGREVGREVG